MTDGLYYGGYRPVCREDLIAAITYVEAFTEGNEKYIVRIYSGCGPVGGPAGRVL